ncbi:nicotinate-nucleotide adenylyltransferase [Caldanaerobius polysaccharolyticus]|uniref:nicotinate-nucleotide adenylyltransferase n=1 Tax=Caldanaerobius polysaccharolyticus TaxID=44256 RepID=UPI00054FA9CB
MGGTFDPIHYGHLVTAEAVRDEFDLDKVVFVPAGNPPHKRTRQVTPGQHRYMMTILATISNPMFEVSAIELTKKGYTYTIDTIREFKEMLPDATFFFITGADAVLEILKWKDSQELLKLCEFVAATRPGFDVSALDKELAIIKEKHNKHIYKLEVPSLAISSTDIRKRVCQGRSIKYLLPETVERYIYKNGLYK